MWDFPLVPEQASSVASTVDALMLFELGVLVFFTALICAMILVFAVKYRRGSKANRSNPPVHDSRLEFLWIALPFALSMAMFTVATASFYKAFAPPADASTIYVVGKQWMWKLQHPEGKREINDLHVPLGRPVRLVMTSQDVIHSFFVPAFRIKQDVLPGRYTEAWFEPTKVGAYHLFCTEYCGTDHSNMIGTVYVMEPADYERWLAGGTQRSSMASEGQALFVQYDCAGCHGPSQTVHAPRLEGIYGKPVAIQDGDAVSYVQADDAYIRDSILLPKKHIVAGYSPIMPSYSGRISEDDLLKIVEYIKSIGPQSEPLPGSLRPTILNPPQPEPSPSIEDGPTTAPGRQEAQP